MQPLASDASAQSPSALPPRASVQTLCDGVFVGAGLGGVRGQRRVEGCWVVTHDEPDPVGRAAEIIRGHGRAGASWALLLSYELGGFVEPRARSRAGDPTGFPACVLMRLGGSAGAWPSSAGAWSLGEVVSAMGRGGYEDRVRRVLEYIAAGDIYQANIAHHLRASFSGDPLSFARALIDHARPRHGAVMGFTLGGRSHTICSVSPELFLRVDPATRVIETQPMKGTRPIGGDARELDSNEKDRAELNMITDLMRNDLGRVCELGSVTVRDARRIEPHDSGVLQATSVVRGVLREGVGLRELIGATFPPGSVTGAPKVRAMQIIDELEGCPRRAYCGSIVHIAPDGRLESSVAIRTAHLHGPISAGEHGTIVDGQLDYAVGAGIVADSDPASEWAETLVKAGVLARSLGVSLQSLS